MESTHGRPRRLAGAAAYLLLFLLGSTEGLIGSFEFSHTLGQIPLAALGFCLLIFATCSLAAIGMSSPLGAVLPALGWLSASVVLAMPTAAGSVIVTNTSAGTWYLYGGAVSAGLGMVLTLRWRPRRATGAGGQGGAT